MKILQVLFEDEANARDLDKAEQVLTNEVKKRIRAGQDSDDAREEVYDGQWEEMFPQFDKAINRIIARGDDEDGTREWLGDHFADFWDYLEV